MLVLQKVVIKYPGQSNYNDIIKKIFRIYTLVFSVFTTLRGAAGTTYTIRAFSNNQVLITKIASYGGIITMGGSILINMLFPIVMRSVPTTINGSSEIWD